MAYIKQTNDRFRVVIRKKGVELSATFDDQQTAELWAFYKESLIDEIENFDVPLSGLILLKDALDMKKNSLSAKGAIAKSIADIEILKKEFSEFIEEPIHKITYEDLMKRFESMTQEIIIKGGNKKNGTGHKRQQSLSTILRKFRALSSVYSHLIEQGVNIENHALKITQYIFFKTKEKIIELSA